MHLHRLRKKRNKIWTCGRGGWLSKHACTCCPTSCSNTCEYFRFLNLKRCISIYIRIDKTVSKLNIWTCNRWYAQHFEKMAPPKCIRSYAQEETICIEQVKKQYITTQYYYLHFWQWIVWVVQIIYVIYL